MDRSVLHFISKIIVCICLIFSDDMVAGGEPLFPVDNPSLKEIESILATQYSFPPELYNFTTSTYGNEVTKIDCYLRCSVVPLFSVSITPQGDIDVKFDCNYSAHNYYDELVQLYQAPFIFWEIEDKAWFSAILPQLCNFEAFRISYLQQNNTYLNLSFAESIMVHKHGTPDKYDISQTVALTAAKEWLLANTKMTCTQLDSYKVASSYYIDISVKHQWSFIFYEGPNRVFELLLNARSAEVEAITYYVH